MTYSGGIRVGRNVWGRGRAERSHESPNAAVGSALRHSGNTQHSRIRVASLSTHPPHVFHDRRVLGLSVLPCGLSLPVSTAVTFGTSVPRPLTRPGHRLLLLPLLCRAAYPSVACSDAAAIPRTSAAGPLVALVVVVVVVVDYI